MADQPTPDSSKAPPQPKTYGTFAGVFTPTILTILGVIMYLRLGWVVGNGGLLGALLVIGLAIGITLATGLSLSSISTNTRLGAGGPYAIIARSLGREIGGSVGVPLYLSQALAVAMYIFGLREGWLWIFPDHPPLLVDLGAFVVIFAIAYISAGLAFRIQFVVMGVIAASIVAIVATPGVWTSSNEIVLWGDFRGSPENGFSGTSFWVVFAVFFPAATGIMAGANMSGELANPRKNIPRGTLSAIAISSVIYVALAIWAAKAASPEELTENYTVLIDRSLSKPLVLAGLLGATFSSALSSLVGAPRILLALGRDELLPKAEWFTQVSASGEPRRGMLVTGALVLGALMMRDLNLIAPLIAMFFLITYAVINLVMLAESTLGLTSFRPTLRLPKVVPLLGALGCIFAMFIVNPTFSLISVGLVVAMYLWMLKSGAGRDSGAQDVRSGFFVAFAQWAATKVADLGIMHAARAWKPNVLVPVRDPATLRGEYRLLRALCHPEGSVKLLGLATSETVDELHPRVGELAQSLRKSDLFTSSAVIDSTDFTTGVVAGLQALGSAFFRPNVLFLSLPARGEHDEELRALLAEARRLRVGVAVCALHDAAGSGREEVVNFWLDPEHRSAGVQASLSQTNSHLGLLLAYRLAKAWGAQLNIVAVARDEGERASVAEFVDLVRDLARIPESAKAVILVGTLDEAMNEAPQSDFDIMGISRELDVDEMHQRVSQTRSSCLFTLDSGNENVLA